ncbi:MAG: DMT family transporter, partial [Pseudomonadota bacterium]|nr:DMT family transporter [Pseudomonadota bacterium]
MFDVLRQRWLALPGNLRGSLLIILSTLVATVMVSFIKVLGERMSVVQILFLRQLMVLAVLAPGVVRDFPGVFRTQHGKLHGLRICVSAIAMVTGFTAFVHLPLAEATAIGFARTLFTTVLEVLILHESVGPRRWSATVLGFIGVLV